MATPPKNITIKLSLVAFLIGLISIARDAYLFGYVPLSSCALIVSTILLLLGVHFDGI